MWSVAHTMAPDSCKLDKGNNNVSAACGKATIMHLLSPSLIGGDKSCWLLVALVSCVCAASDVSLATVDAELASLLFQEARRPPELGAGHAPALHNLQRRGQDGRQQD